MIVRKILFFKSVQCVVKKYKTSLKFLGHFVLFVKKNLGQTVPPEGIFCPRDVLSQGPFCSRDVPTRDVTS
jgi:hypothetical protein